MDGETFTSVGTQMYPVNWTIWAATLALLPFYRKILGRIPASYIVVCTAGLLISLLNVPTIYRVGFYLPILGICAASLTAEKKFQKTGRRQKTSYLSFLGVAAFPLFMQFLWLTTTIHLGDNEMETFINHKRYSIQRQILVITDFRTWFSFGYDGKYRPNSAYGLMVGADDVYCTSRFGLISGDEVAHRISEWSGSKPRYFPNDGPSLWMLPFQRW